MACTVFLAGIVLPAVADESFDQTKYDAMVERGIEYLREQGQAEDGTFSIEAGSGITSLALTAALRHGVPLDDPMMAKGLEALEGFVQPDGGIYHGTRLKNYETCVAIVCLNEANEIAGDGRYDEILRNAEKFVRRIQYGAVDDMDEANPYYGGVGYGGAERPDLSNTMYLIEALVALDAPPSDPAIQRALNFIGRCQNLDGEWNDTYFGSLVNDGGFYYVIETESIDPDRSDRYDESGGLRSYGAMSYAGFKSMVYAGLTDDDPRVKAVMDWISKHYSVEHNPGMGNAGLFYYYNTFGSALAASRLDKVVDDDGESHPWQADLVNELSHRQRPDGSWLNANARWFENDANLTTAFSLLALAHCEEAQNQATEPTAKEATSDDQ